MCPFYLTRELAKTADIVFMPYNYLIDPRVRAGLTNLNLEGSTLIFDEAHNVEVRTLSSDLLLGTLKTEPHLFTKQKFA